MYNKSMNRLSTDDRVRVLAALVEGNSIRGTARMCGVDKENGPAAPRRRGRRLRRVPGPNHPWAAIGARPMRRDLVVLPRQRAKFAGREARCRWRRRYVDLDGDRRRYQADRDVAPWASACAVTPIYSSVISPAGSSRSGSKSRRTASGPTTTRSSGIFTTAPITAQRSRTTAC